MDLNKFILTAIHRTPELIGRILLVIKTTVIVYLNATYLGHLGLLAFLVYDNIETLIYMIITGIAKTISPFLTLFYNEQDYPSVEYITKLATKHLLIGVIAITTIFIIYPQILLKLFNIRLIHEQSFVSFTIRITSIGLIGRCMNLLISSYSQSIFDTKISALINILQEGILPLIFILILIPIFKGLGIWYTITLSDTIPVVLYFIMILYKRKEYTTLKNCALNIPESISFQWTSIKGTFEKKNEIKVESNKIIIQNIKEIFNEDYLIITESLEDIAKNIFTADKRLYTLDISVLINEGFILLRFIYDGKKYDPFKNEQLLKKEKNKKLNKFNPIFNYYRILDMNFAYVKIRNIKQPPLKSN